MFAEQAWKVWARADTEPFKSFLFWEDLKDIYNVL